MKMISHVEKMIIACLFFMALVGLQMARIDLALYEGIFAREDGPLEWMTVLALFCGALMTSYRVWTLKNERPRWFLFCLTVLAVLFLFGAGEEISWGQRLFGIKSSEFFMQNNSQMETNLHNLIVSGVKINKLIFGVLLGVFVGLYFLVLPFLYKKSEQVRSFIDMSGVPIPRWQHILLYILLFLLVSITPSPKKGEILEFGGCWIFFLLAYNPLNQNIYRCWNQKKL